MLQKVIQVRLNGYPQDLFIHRDMEEAWPKESVTTVVSASPIPLCRSSLPVCYTHFSRRRSCLRRRANPAVRCRALVEHVLCTSYPLLSRELRLGPSAAAHLSPGQPDRMATQQLVRRFGRSLLRTGSRFSVPPSSARRRMVLREVDPRRQPRYPKTRPCREMFRAVHLSRTIVVRASIGIRKYSFVWENDGLPAGRLSRGKSSAKKKWYGWSTGCCLEVRRT